MEIRAMILGLMRTLPSMVLDEGDAAYRALQLVQAWRAATWDHPAHGRNWFAKYRSELEPLLRLLMPDVLPPEPEIEGERLNQLVLEMFPGSWRAPHGWGQTGRMLGHWE